MAKLQKVRGDDTRDNFQIIQDALVEFGGPQKSSGDSRFICCPYPEHGGVDNTPSLSVYMQIEGKVPLGFNFCFGCGTRGPWNKLAEVIKAPKIKEWKKSKEINESIITEDLEQSLLGESGITFKNVLKVMHHEEAQRWPRHLEWRGFDGNLIYKVGGHIINDQQNDNIGLIFPIKINGKVRGGVKAVYERKGKQLGYLNMKGDWTKNYGLFPYMYAEKLIARHRYKFVILVEGPRDALRLCSLGIPALAILGATSMSPIKSQLVINMNVNTVYVISDNDKGGNTMWRSVKKVMKNNDAITLQRLKLPVEHDKKGNLIKIDPGNASNEIVGNIMSLLRERHGFRIPKRLREEYSC